MISTRFWILFFIIILIIASILSLFVMNAGICDTAIANIYRNGEQLYSINLSDVSDEYTIQIEGVVINTVTVAHRRICISDATCPDHVCVNQGWITNGVVPIVCLPNGVVIQIEGVSDTDVDAIVK